MFFRPTSLFLSLPICVFCSYLYIGSSPSRCCLHFHTNNFVPNIWYLSIWGSSTRCRSSSVNKQHFWFSFLGRKEKRKDEYEATSHCVKSLIEVSWSVVLCPCDCNHSRWAPCATPGPIVPHPVKRHSNRSRNAIHPLVVTSCSRLVSNKQPQIRASFGWPTYGRTVGSVPLIICSHPKQNRPKQSAHNRYLEIGIRHTIRS